MGCVFCIPTSRIGVVARFGKFDRIVEPGMNFKLPLIESQSSLTTRHVQLKATVDTKTLDNVFCNVIVAIIYSVKIENLYNAMYTYQNVQEQIDSYVQNEIRSELTKLTLDESFMQKSAISDRVKQVLKENLGVGFHFHTVLINDIEPDAKVRVAMNEINVQQRLRIAKEQQVAAYKMETISKAEVDASSMKIEADGIAQSKVAVINGLRNSFVDLPEHLLADLLIQSEKIAMMKEIGGQNTIFIPYDGKTMINLAV